MVFSIVFVVVWSLIGLAEQNDKSKANDVLEYYKSVEQQRRLLSSLKHKEDKVFFENYFKNRKQYSVYAKIKSNILSIFSPKLGLHQIAVVQYPDSVWIDGEILHIKGFENNSIVKIGEEIVNYIKRKKKTAMNLILASAYADSEDTEIQGAINMYIYNSTDKNSKNMITTEKMNKYGLTKIIIESLDLKNGNNIQCGRGNIVLNADSGKIIVKKVKGDSFVTVPLSDGEFYKYEIPYREFKDLNINTEIKSDVYIDCLANCSSMRGDYCPSECDKLNAKFNDSLKNGHVKFIEADMPINSTVTHCNGEKCISESDEKLFESVNRLSPLWSQIVDKLANSYQENDIENLEIQKKDICRKMDEAAKAENKSNLTNLTSKCNSLQQTLKDKKADLLKHQEVTTHIFRSKVHATAIAMTIIETCCEDVQCIKQMNENNKINLISDPN
jgi:hypothetical protein